MGAMRPTTIGHRPNTYQLIAQAVDRTQKKDALALARGLFVTRLFGGKGEPPNFYRSTQSSIANIYLDELKTFHTQRAATMGFEGLAGFAETYGCFQIDRD